jgi:hypothetical protein
MHKTMGLLLLIGLTGANVVFPQVPSGKASQSSEEILNVAFCDLFGKQDAYDGHEVRVRVRYVSTFEVSALVDKKCIKELRVWAEFDRESVKCRTTPEVLKKLENQIYCCMFADLSSIRETEMLVTGVFHKANAQGYGHGSDYRLMFTIKSVQEIEPTETIKVPGFGGTLSAGHRYCNAVFR